MKILAFVDLHGSLKALKRLQALVDKEKPDVIVCAGDISIFEQNLDYLVHRISKFKKPVFIVHGNHEEEGILKKSCSLFENVNFIHGKAQECNGVLFIGWGGGGFSTSDKEFEKKSKEFSKELEKYEKAVLITHAPPYNTRLDRIIEESCGNKSIRKFISENTKKIKIAVSGHLHENSGKEDHVKETRVINPGPFGKIVNV
ncbi:metallophosphoesterase family protein [Candidatus Woesearchaeota archaeon]|nr:metallophosphoesterase family protein [Candidatus Woesearchaeota archaeon]